MARLLDLPPEMFQNIIHHLVDDVGTCEAWKLRGTCRTFAAEITHDILSNEPEGRSACRACERIMKNKVSDFLVIQVNRTKDSSEVNRLKNSPDGTRGFLTVIPKMLDYLGQELSLSAKEREQMLPELCERLTHIIGSGAVWHMWFSKLDMGFRIDEEKELNLGRKLAAAIATDNNGLVRILLDGSSVTDCAKFLRGPLHMAVRKGDVALLDIFTGHIRSLSKSDGRRALDQFNIRAAVDTAVFGGGLTLVKYIVDFYIEIARKKVTNGAYFAWLKEAIRTENVDIALHILRLCPKKGCKVVSPIFSDACRTGSLEMVNMFLNEGNMDVDKGSYYTHPLMLAIRTGTAPVVAAVLDAGADVNLTRPHDERLNNHFPRNRWLLQAPLTAVEVAFRRDPSILDLMLERGAKLPALVCWPETEELYVKARDVALNHGYDNIPEFEDL